MNTVKYIADIETPTDFTAFLVDGGMFVPMDEMNRHYQEVQEWIAGGNTPEPAFTQDELDAYAKEQNKTIQNSMLRSGNELSVQDTTRVDVGANSIINDKPAHKAWLKDLYDAVDADNDTLPKPPPANRQLIPIDGEDKDPYEFTRYQDQWGWRWYLRLHRESVNALAIAIYDAVGNYLYTTGALIAHPDGGWYTECPAGQADQNPEDVYYKWLLGSANISDLEVYYGQEDSKEGFVRSDTRYDL